MFTGAVRVLATCLLTFASMLAADWQVGVSPASGGRYSSLRIDKSGNAHVCSVSQGNTILSYSFLDAVSKKWFTTELDRSAGFCSLALDSHQRPHISYIGYGTNLRYVHWTGTSWERPELRIRTKTIAYETSIA